MGSDKAIKAKKELFEHLENLRLKCYNMSENGTGQLDNKQSNVKTGLENKTEGGQNDTNLGHLADHVLVGSKEEKDQYEMSGENENSVKKNITGAAADDIEGSGYEISGDRVPNDMSGLGEMSRGIKNDTLREKAPSLKN